MTPILREENYSATMSQIVEPYLSEYRTIGKLTLTSPLFVTYEVFKNPSAIGNIVISHGFTESALKFHEMAYYFHKAGYSVFLINHLGHADSYREVEDTSLTHIEHFDDYVDSFHYFIESICLPESEMLPVYLYGHSMGGAICA